MAKLVTISCLSGLAVGGVDLGVTVDRLIEHWRGRLDVVLPDRPDLIVLPEWCDSPGLTGLPIDRRLEFLHHRGDRVRDFFAEVAAQHRCHIAYSALRIAPDGALLNSIQMIDRTGAVVGVYDKNHVTVGEYEDGGSYGTEIGVFDLDIGRVGGVICFDLNFDELRAAYQQARPDLLVFSSMYHGGLMQQIWAYSCRAYLAATVYPPAPSSITSPVGQVVATSTNYRNEVTATVNLDYAVMHIDRNGRKFPEVKRKYGRKVRIHDPGQLGSVLMSSETDELTIADVIREFELEPLDDYFARVRAHRASHLDRQTPLTAR